MKNIEFESFEQALAVCVHAEEGSDLQKSAMIYCLENAPPELQAALQERFLRSGEDRCGCGHDDCHHGKHR